MVDNQMVKEWDHCDGRELPHLGDNSEDIRSVEQPLYQGKGEQDIETLKSLLKAKFPAVANETINSFSKAYIAMKEEILHSDQPFQKDSLEKFLEAIKENLHTNNHQQ